MSRKAEMPAIAYVVARSYPDSIIGCDNQMPWHLRSDLRRFRQITESHAVIMGRKTFESIGRPLPNRLNIVMTRTLEPDQPNVIWVNSRESALFFADLYSIVNSRRDVFVIGGSEIFDVFSDLFYMVYLTVVMAPELHRLSNQNISRFDYEFDHRNWKTLEEEDYPSSAADDYPTRFLRLKKKQDIYHRYRDLQDFLTADAKVTYWREQWANTAPKRAIRSETDLVEQLNFFWPESLDPSPKESAA